MTADCHLSPLMSCSIDDVTWSYADDCCCCDASVMSDDCWIPNCCYYCASLHETVQLDLRSSETMRLPVAAAVVADDDDDDVLQTL